MFPIYNQYVSRERANSKSRPFLTNFESSYHVNVNKIKVHFSCTTQRTLTFVSGIQINFTSKFLHTCDFRICALLFGAIYVLT